jgi:hypothetical protein
MILFIFVIVRQYIFKDYEAMRSSIGLIAKRQPSRKMLFVFLGEGGPTERINQTEIRFVPY